MKVISLGLGTQSVTLYLMSSLGLIERADYAIFADPGAEAPETYAYLTWLLSWQKKNNGIEIRVCGKKTIYEDLISGMNSTGQRFISIPAFTKDQNGNIGMVRRQCTSEYKTVEVDKEIRRINGLKPRERNTPVDVMIGFTTDEVERMTVAQEKWKTFVYPLVKLRLSRTDCINWLKKNNFPVPPKSACEFCPFQSDARWLQLKQSKPHVFNKLVEFDNKLRERFRTSTLKDPMYLHRSCKPLSEVKFKNEEQETFNWGCYGECGT